MYGQWTHLCCTELGANHSVINTVKCKTSPKKGRGPVHIQRSNLKLNSSRAAGSPYSWLGYQTSIVEPSWMWLGYGFGTNAMVHNTTLALALHSVAG